MSRRQAVCDYRMVGDSWICLLTLASFGAVDGQPFHNPVREGLPTIRALRVNSLCKALAYRESGTISSLLAVQAKNKPSTEEKDMQSKPSIVFCHGLWADGSCFNKLIVPLQAEGYESITPQPALNPPPHNLAV